MYNDEPLVSVLMTSYNRERYISEAIESVLSSTYKNFELIIVDDGSKDRTVEIAKSYVNKDNRIKVYVNEKNLGDYPNRNKAASYAKGKYLKYVDADDAVYYWAIEVEVKMMEKYPNAALGLEARQDDNKMFPFELSPSESYSYNFNTSSIFGVSPISALIRRDVFEKEGGFSSERMVSDYEFWLRIAAKYKIVLLPSGITFSRVHDSQESNAISTNLNFPFRYEMIKKLYLSSLSCPLNKEDQLIHLNKSKSNLSLLIIKCILQQRNFYLAKSFSAQSKISIASAFFNVIKNYFKS